jgi:hypothetical protein
MSDNPYTAGEHAGDGMVEPRSHMRVITRFTPLQLGKLLAVIYFAISLLVVPFILLASLAGPKGSGMGLIFVILIPLLYALIGFLTGIIGAFIYNLCAKFVGGIEVEIH